MPRAQPLRHEAGSPVWAALADPTRRAILDRLREGPRTVGQLTDEFPTSRFAIRKHLNILEAARLVVVRWNGRERWNYLNATPIHTVCERWLTPYRQLWAGSRDAQTRDVESRGVSSKA